MTVYITVNVTFLFFFSEHKKWSLRFKENQSSNCRNLEDKIKFCLRKFNLPETSADQQKLRKGQSSDLKTGLIERAKEEISFFTEYWKYRNIYANNGPTTTEWTYYWKMVGNVAPTATRLVQEELIRLSRHNNIVKVIANALWKLNWQVFEQFCCIASDGLKQTWTYLSLW